MGELRRRIEWLFRHRRFASELEEELRHHLALKREMQDADTAARQFGNLALIKEESRLMWIGRLPDQLLQDARFGVRAMAHNKLFTAMVVVSLALGIGANTAIYSFMDAVLMRQLPVPNPSQLTILNWAARDRTPVAHSINGSMFRDDGRGRASPNFPYPAWDALRKNTNVFQSLFAFARAYKLSVVSDGQAEIVPSGLYVSGDFYSGLGVKPAAGRLIGSDDDRPGAARVAVLSYDYFQARFAGKREVVGSTLTINAVPFTIIGVSAPGYEGIDTGRLARITIPLHAMPLFAPKPDAEERHRFLDGNFYWLEMMGRLKPGVTIGQAEPQVRGVFASYAESTAGTEKERKGAKPQLWLEDGVSGLDGVRRRYSKPLFVLMTMVGLILAIACANVANLMLSRATARRRETAVRMSIGAARGRVVRQLLTESVMLSFSGGLLGLLVAFAGIRGIGVLIADPGEGVHVAAQLDWPVLLFTFGLAVLTGVIFGLAPAMQATKVNLAPALKEVRSGAATARRTRFGLRFGPGHALVVVQVAMSLLLAVAAGLFVRTLASLNAIDLGFNRENLLTFTIDARQAGYRDQALGTFYGNLLARFRTIPGVKSASLSDFLLVSQHWNDEPIAVPGYTPPPGEKPSSAELRVDAAFFPTMQIPILVGRGFEPRDMASPRVAVVNELFAKKYFPGANPVGRRIGVGDGNAADIEIIGVAKNAHYNSIQEETPTVVYAPYTQNLPDLRGVSCEIRTVGDPAAVAATVRRVVHDANPTIPMDDVTTQAAVIDATISQQRTFADLCSGFAILALAIASVGLYGTMAYGVARRTGEIGIRMALGAKPGGVIWMVLRQVIVLTAIGLAIGLAAARESGHVVESFLYGVKSKDLFVTAGSAGLLAAAALIAGLGPAWRASRIDPVAALRHE